MNRHPGMPQPSAARMRMVRTLNRIVSELIAAMVFMILGAATPGWLFTTGTGYTVHMGLWYTVSCLLTVCKVTSSFDVFSSYYYVQTSLYLTEYRGETTSAIVFCFLAAILLRLCRNRLHNPIPTSIVVIMWIGGSCVLLSGILAASAAGKFGHIVMEGYQASSRIDGLDGLTRLTGLTTESYSIPYSLITFAVGGLQVLIACIVFLAGQPWRVSAESQEPPMQANQDASYPPQVATVHSEYQQPQQSQMYAMSPMEKGSNPNLRNY